MNVYDLNVLSTKLLDAGATQIVLLRHDPDNSFVGVLYACVEGLRRLRRFCGPLTMKCLHSELRWRCLRSGRFRQSF